MLIKFIILIFVLINLRIPFVSLVDILLIWFLIFLLISSKSILSLKQLIFQKYKVIFILILLTIVNFVSPKFKIEEAHSVFINDNDLNIIGNFLPSNILTDIKNKFKEFDIKSMIKSDNIFTVENYNKLETINSPYAFSSDSFFQNNKFTRQVNKINFSSRENLRLGHLNTLKYNLVHDKHFRRILPYYVLYEIPKTAKNSELCISGNSYYYFSKKNINTNEIKNLPFTKKQFNKECLKLKKNFEKLYIIGFSINDKDNLSIHLKKNYLLKLLDIIYFIIISILIIICSFFLLQIKFYINSFIYFLSTVCTFLLALIFDKNMIFGLRYFRGGADGLWHNSRAQDIVQNLSEGNYFIALRGGESVFYFMPGLRYVEAFSKFFFGDTNYAYLLLATFLPLGIFIFFYKYLNRKYALILFISFIFVPIFENMGFGFFNYIWQIARNHAETLSIVLILLSLTLIVDLNENYKKIRNEKTILVLIGLALAVAAMCRPNFFPTTSILCFYTSLICILNKHYFKSILILFGYSLILLCLVHNVYFGNSYKFFTNVEVHFVFNQIFLQLNPQNDNINILLSQFLLWNPLYNIHRLVILILIIYFILSRKQCLFTYSLFLCIISQHAVLLLTHPSSRYAYLAWLLTLILFMKIEFDNKLFKSIYLFFKKLITVN